MGSVNFLTARAGVNSKTPSTRYRSVREGSDLRIMGRSSGRVGEESRRETVDPPRFHGIVRNN